METYFLFSILQLLLLNSVNSFSLVIAANNETDVSALISFKSLISGDPFGTLSSWNGSIHYCQWKGVQCGRRHPNRVTALTLDSVKLSGQISPSLVNLTFLQTLSLSDNQLTGTIPEELGLLSRMKFLNLSVNSLDGSIPSTIGNCSNLEYLNIRNNNLQGAIPPEIMHCKNLVMINLKGNLLNGSIPPELGTLQQLVNLFLDENYLNGPIPQTMGNLTSLLSIDLGDNRLSSSIPSSLGKLQFLQNLYLGFNNLSGEIPNTLYNISAMVGLGLTANQVEGTLSSNMCDTLPNLQYLQLYGNRFEGQIPTSISNCSALTIIGLDSNYFTGTIPASVGTLQNISLLQMSFNQLEAKKPSDWSFIDKLSNCTNLQVLDIGGNQLQGTIPNTIANLSRSVLYLGLYTNQISGSIPADISKLTNLVTLELGQASLQGTIPKEIGRLWNLQSLGLSWNMLTGEIPSTFGNLTKLNKLYLENNALTGNVPVELGKLQVLDLLMLSNNKLTGKIPKEIFNLASLSIGFDLSNNYLNGSIPPEIGKLNNVVEVNLSNNKLSGQIPTTIDGCQVLQVLHLDGNLLEGVVPSSLSNMKGLQYLDISNNNFSGPIPEFLGEMKLQHLNISYNNFEGALPKDGVFKDIRAVDIKGNPKLCGGVPEMHLPKCVLDSQKKMYHSRKIMVIILCSTSAFICLGIVMCFITHYYWKRRTRYNPQPVMFIKFKFQKVSYSDILRATNNFSLENLIGKGGFGSVYRASMEFENGSTLAVKVLNLEMHGASRSFLSECEVLKKVRHRNLIKVLTLSACSSTDHNGNVFKALIFEFKTNGNLETWLHPNACMNRPFRCLDLMERLNVAIDVATALDYLHNNGCDPIVHCDLKPSNVLLDEDMTACVSDFGLARFLVPPNTMSSSLTTSSVGIKGSIGYIPPEYGMGGKPSIEGDTYSFGILLLEMFTGISPTDERLTDGVSLHEHVDMAFSDHIMDIIDPKLFSVDLGTEKTHAPQDVHDFLVLVVKCGLLCSAAAPKDRMEMKQVVKELVSAREKLLK